MIDCNEKIIVWKVHLPAMMGLLVDADQIISADELDRAQQFKFTKDRHAFLLCRLLLRLILAHYLGCEAKAIRFDYNAYGKPVIAQLNFNLSHSGDWMVLAISGNAIIGVDVEYQQHRSVSLSLARFCFSDQEFAAFESLPDEQQQSAFFHIWTCKEALIKAIGQGVSFGLKNISISMAVEHKPIVLQMHGDQASCWQLRHFHVADSYQAAMAWKGKISDIDECHLYHQSDLAVIKVR